MRRRTALKKRRTRSLCSIPWIMKMNWMVTFVCHSIWNWSILARFKTLLVSKLLRSAIIQIDWNQWDRKWLGVQLSAKCANVICLYAHELEMALDYFAPNQSQSVTSECKMLLFQNERKDTSNIMVVAFMAVPRCKYLFNMVFDFFFYSYVKAVRWGPDGLYNAWHSYTGYDTVLINSYFICSPKRTVTEG